MPSYLVTGASRGIGLEFVRQISSDPENIVFALVRNAATAQELNALPNTNVHIVQADITDRTALRSVAAEVSDATGGKLDYLINNAAYIEETRRRHPLDGYPESQEDDLEKDLLESFRINVVGVIHTINAFLPLIRKGTIKKVITLSTGLADVGVTLAIGFSSAAPYSISKSGLNMAVAKYAAEYKDEGIVFLAISPGIVDTSTRQRTAQEIEEYKAMVASIQRVAPHFKGAITPEESVKAQLKIIYGVTIKDTGAFVSHHGNKEWV